MSAHRQDLPFIPLGGWRTQAACTRRVNELLWDDRLDDETEKQRQARHRAAKAVCRNECPVRAECADDADWKIDEGVRGGHKLPSLGSQHTREEAEMLRLLKQGLPLDVAARLV